MREAIHATAAGALGHPHPRDAIDVINRFDTSRGRTRRWCDMNPCGKHEKKARRKARRG